MQTYTSTPDFYKDYISHHGILGMKWGQRNGPPYPLSAGDHSAAEKKAGYKKSIKGSDTDAGVSKTKKHKHSKQAKPNKQFEKEYKDILNSAKTDEEKDIRIRELEEKYTNPRIKITRDDKYGLLETSVKNGSRDVKIHCFEDNVDEATFRNAVKDFSKNKASIEKQAKEVIANDDSQYSIYKLYAERNGISKKQFKDSLEIKSLFVYDNNGNAEVSLWEKDDVKENLTGGHSLDIEVNLKNKKVDRHYSMNG